MANEDNNFRVPLNTLGSMFNLGKSISVKDQCKQNLRFIFQESENPRNRNILRRAFGNDAIRLNGSNHFQHKHAKGLTPFRLAFNAGDSLVTQNMPPNSGLQHTGSNQINLPNHNGVGDGTHTHPKGSAYSGNPRFVYDGSDFTKYKKLKAINRNYRDITFGGDQHHASQHAYRRVI